MIMSSANCEFCFFFSDLDFFYLFIYSSLIAVVRTFKAILNNRGEIGHPCLLGGLLSTNVPWGQKFYDDLKFWS